MVIIAGYTNINLENKIKKISNNFQLKLMRSNKTNKNLLIESNNMEKKKRIFFY